MAGRITPKEKAPVPPAMPPLRSLHDPMATGVILLAAGSSRRFGGRRPKQFLPLQGLPLFLRSFRTFSRLRSVTDIVVVASPSDLKSVVHHLRRFKPSQRVSVVAG